MRCWVTDRYMHSLTKHCDYYRVNGAGINSFRLEAARTFIFILQGSLDI